MSWGRNEFGPATSSSLWRERQQHKWPESLRATRVFLGVDDGARTRDFRLHKPALCQLSYAHQGDHSTLSRDATTQVYYR